MVTKLRRAIRWGGYGLPVRFFLKFWGLSGVVGRVALRPGKLRGLQGSPVFDVSEAFAQIFDNLVGCSKEELVSTLSQNRGDLLNSTCLYESLIPAQNQRWRRA